MSWSNAKEALQSAPAGPDPGLRGGRAQSLLHQGGGRAVHHPVGRQPAIRGLEEHLGIALFERRHRSLVLTDQGRALYGAATDLLERLQGVTDRLRADGVTPHLTVTTTNGFASLWLIPRLRGFTAVHPDVDVRISASYKLVALERSLVDVAVRCARTEEAPEGAVGCSGRSCFPSAAPRCSATGRSAAYRRRTWRITRCCTWTVPAGPLDWGTWLAAQGFADLKPAPSLQLRQLRSDDQRRAERPGRGHGDRQPGPRA